MRLSSAWRRIARRFVALPPRQLREPALWYRMHEDRVQGMLEHRVSRVFEKHTSIGEAWGEQYR